MKIRLRLADPPYHLEAVNESGNTVHLDASPGIGGENRGARPMELMLIGLAGCSGIDVIHMLRKQRQPLEGLEVSVEADRHEDQVPALFREIRVHFRATGPVEPARLERAVRLSMEKYCSVARILERTARIDYTCDPSSA